MEDDSPAAEGCEEDAPPPTAEELRLERYDKMLRRAGFEPAEHLERLQCVQRREGADTIKLGVVSGKQYKGIFERRAFDQYFFQIPTEKSSLELMPEVARKILSKDPAIDDQLRRDEEKASHIKVGGGPGVEKARQKLLKEEARTSRIGFKKVLFGPPGLAPPQTKILNSEGREKYFSYDGDWIDGNMDGYGTFCFADGMTYRGVMRNNRPCGEGTALYPNGAMYVGRWKDGKCEGNGKLTYATGTVYDGRWQEGRRSGHGKLKYKSGSIYTGAFLLGVFHGRGKFESANLDVVYEGWWETGFMRGYGTLIMPDGTKLVRSWPAQSRLGGRLSLRGAMELVQFEQEKARLEKIDEKEALYGVAELAELQYRVKNVRQEFIDRRARDKEEEKAESAAKRKEAKLALMEKKLKALLDEEKEAELDDIEKEFRK